MAARDGIDGWTDPGQGEDEEGPLVLGDRVVRPGDTIGGYVFDRELGSGGMARVLLARGPDGRQVALKVLRRSRLSTGVGRFRREFLALSRLDHANVVRVHAYGDLHGHPFIAMEYVDGPDLHQVIRGFRGWPDERRFVRCRELLIDLCRALSAIHRRGLVHRDLKPSNVLLTASGVCKLTDFGIVKDLDPARVPELSTTLVGTWAYASPEHISGHPVDHRSDLYSLGVILFAMLTGKRPFTADNMAGYLQAHRDRPVPRPSTVRPGVPADLDEIAVRLLQKAPRDRFQSAQEVLYRLEADDPDATFEGQAAWEPPLVGNASGVEAIEDAVSGLTARRGGVVQVLGDDGMGKTRLVRAAVDHARMLGLPFHVVTFHEGAPVYEGAMRLARELLGELPELAAEELRRLVRDWRGGTPLRGDVRYTLYDVLRTTLAGMLAERPRVLLFDDLHVAGPQEVDLVRYLARHLLGADLPVLVVVTGRPSIEADAEAWGAGVATRRLVLEPLEVRDLEVLVGSLLGPGRHTTQLALRLHAETEGNPLFVTEFLRSLMAQGLLVRVDRGWRLTVEAGELASGRFEVPPGIREVLRRRLETVTAGDRAVLDVLAVAGQPVELDVLLDVLDVGEDVVLQQLDRLLRGGLVREHRAADGPAYQAIHARLADLLRRDLSIPHRQALHRALAIALEVAHGQDATVLEVIGEHYRQAGDAARAYAHLVGAARRLVDRALHDEATRLLDIASEVELAARGEFDDRRFRELRADLLHVRGLTQRLRGEWAASAAAYREQAELADELGDAKVAAEARVGLAHGLRRTGDLAGSHAAATAARSLAVRAHHRKGLALAEHALAGLAFSQGDFEGTLSHALEGLQHCDGPALAQERAQLLTAAGTARAMQGDLEPASRELAEAEALLAALRMKPQRVIVLGNLSELQQWHGEADEAWRRADEAVRDATALGFTLGRLAGLRARGGAALDLGQYDDAHADLTEAAELGARIDVPEEVLAARVGLVRLALERGDPAAARRHGAQALQADLTRDPERTVPLLQALLARALGPARAEVAVVLLRAVEDALPTLHTPRRLQVLVATAWAWLALGDKNAAAQRAREVIQHPASTSFRLLVLEARALLGMTTAGAEASSHRRIGAGMARAFTDALPVQTSEEVRRRPVFRTLAAPDAGGHDEGLDA